MEHGTISRETNINIINLSLTLACIVLLNYYKSLETIRNNITLCAINYSTVAINYAGANKIKPAEMKLKIIIICPAFSAKLQFIALAGVRPPCVSPSTCWLASQVDFRNLRLIIHSE